MRTIGAPALIINIIQAQGEDSELAVAGELGVVITNFILLVGQHIV